MANLKKGEVYHHKNNCSCFRCAKTAWNKGKTLSKDHRNKISMTHVGKTPWNKNRHPTYVQGENHPMYGKHHTEEANEKNRQAHLGKKFSFETIKKLSGRVPWNKGKIGFLSGNMSPHWKGGKPKCKDCGKEIYYGRKRCIKCFVKSPERIKSGIASVLKQSRSNMPTSIEKKVYDELKMRGLLFEMQKIIDNKYIIDAYIPNLNLIIEADGDYWHSFEHIKKKDKNRDIYLKSKGFDILRLTEKEINNGNFKMKLQEVLQ